MQIKSFADLRPGQIVPELMVEIDRAALIRYAGASDDYMPQHWDHPYMVGQGYTDVVVHGWLTMAHMCRAVSRWVPLQLATIRHYSVRYNRPLHPGTLRCGGAVKVTDGKNAELSLWGRNVNNIIVAVGSISLEESGLISGEM
jgi:acyl dehydratase